MSAVAHLLSHSQLTSNLPTKDTRSSIYESLNSERDLCTPDLNFKANAVLPTSFALTFKRRSTQKFLVLPPFNEFYRRTVGRKF